MKFVWILLEVLALLIPIAVLVLIVRLIMKAARKHSEQ